MYADKYADMVLKKFKTRWVILGEFWILRTAGRIELDPVREKHRSFLPYKNTRDATGISYAEITSCVSL